MFEIRKLKGRDFCPGNKLFLDLLSLVKNILSLYICFTQFLMRFFTFRLSMLIAFY